MRLTCPNCGAQYEVPDEVIPEDGRDVQCSNCGDTWFQQHPHHAPLDAQEEDAPAPAPSKDGTPETATATKPPADLPGTDMAETPAPRTDENRPSARTAGPSVAPDRRSVDPAVADILRQEAEREKAVRTAEATGGLETQPELGLSQRPGGSDDRSRHAQARMDRPHGTTTRPIGPTADDADDYADIDPASRRNLLPDIEEINSSLSSHQKTSHQEKEAPEQVAIPEYTSEPVRRSGFGRGFRLAILIFILATLIYLLSPLIAGQFPAAEGPLAQYVATVDNLRLWLDSHVSAAIGWFSKMSAPATGN
ncbi:MJ0042 family finger-like domain-containing protein [Roseovarius azorensis]|uniref:MJ0042 family finger-like domain-containing protein n=1 Tax=Roseovarius azorensis TaxID=1287727 RepID=A0A1H7PSR0_9RHOB|nr:zinc-ribbon domain-containing protein [Roseovarius azorensis]SEL38921.1 MJ0042 family finger-like domain-containing protein [Roseovarius azorensis]